jgi:hypothetical protein
MDTNEGFDLFVSIRVHSWPIFVLEAEMLLDAHARPQIRPSDAGTKPGVCSFGRDDVEPRGANTAIFSVINAVLLKPLPYPDSGALVRVFEKRPRENRERNPVSPADFFDWREQATSFERMAAFEATAYNYSAKPYPVQIPAVLVSPGFFELVRARPLLGRTFLPEGEVRGRHLVVMLTHSFWQERLGGGGLHAHPQQHAPPLSA